MCWWLEMVNDKIEKHRWWCCGIIFALMCFSLCGFGSLYLFAMHGKKQTAQRCFFSEIRCAERNYGNFFIIKKGKRLACFMYVFASFVCICVYLYGSNTRKDDLLILPLPIHFLQAQAHQWILRLLFILKSICYHDVECMAEIKNVF